MTLSPTPTLPITVALDNLAPLGAAVTTVAALNAAEDLGAFDRLRSGPTNAAGLARDCAIGERGARLLLSTLISLGLVEPAGDGRYALTATGAYVTHLRSSLSGLGAAIRDDRPLVGHAPINWSWSNCHPRLVNERHGVRSNRDGLLRINST